MNKRNLESEISKLKKMPKDSREVEVQVIGIDQKGLEKKIKWNLVEIEYNKYAFIESYYGSSTYANTPIVTKNNKFYSLVIKVICNGINTIFNISEENIKRQIKTYSSDIDSDEDLICCNNQLSSSKQSDLESLPEFDELSMPPPPLPLFPKILCDNNNFVLTLSLRGLHRFPGNPFEISGCHIEFK